MRTVPVYEWNLPDGSSTGLGTALEFEYWKREGTIPEGAEIGAVLCHEPVAADAKRAKAWGFDAADLPDDHPLLQHLPVPPVLMGRALRRELEAL